MTSWQLGLIPDLDTHVAPPRDRRLGGYAAQPGTGPAGETCGTCRHLARVQKAKTYRKCGLMQKHWTGGRGTDVKSASPACRHWEVL
ncbi:MAG: hypothetical protein OEW11_09640 [Nitrospirota bacterium]|nr:hypothetical protein [Nitrospirota bacterium]